MGRLQQERGGDTRCQQPGGGCPCGGGTRRKPAVARKGLPRRCHGRQKRHHHRSSPPSLGPAVSHVHALAVPTKIHNGPGYTVVDVDTAQRKQSRGTKRGLVQREQSGDS